MRESSDPWVRGLVDSLTGAYETITATDSDQQARHFHARCRDLDGDARAYWSYRADVRLSHPTIELVDHYVHAKPDDVNRIGGIRVTPTPLAGDARHDFTRMSMIWSARALTGLAPSSTYRSFLRSTRQLGTTADLKLASDYHERRATAARRQREASEGQAGQ